MRNTRSIILVVLTFVAVCLATAYLKPDKTEPVAAENALENESNVKPEADSASYEAEEAAAQTKEIAQQQAAESATEADNLSNKTGQDSPVGEIAKVDKVNEVSETRREENEKNKNGRPRLALVIDDVGFNLKIAEKILSLKIPATWAIINEAPQAQKIASLATENGQPFLMHVQMQALVDKTGGSDYVIGVDTPASRIESYLLALHDRYPQAVGINNHRGSKATADARTMQAVMRTLSKTGWGFLDSRTNGKSIAYKVAGEYDIPVQKNNGFIDGTTDLDTMKKRFDTVIRYAKKHGVAVAICHAREKTLPFLKYVSEARPADVELVLLDQIWQTAM